MPPRTASRQNSVFDRVQCPIPQNALNCSSGNSLAWSTSADWFVLTQTKAQVLYENPQASITLSHAERCGQVPQTNRADCSAAMSRIGRAQMSSVDMVG